MEGGRCRGRGLAERRCHQNGPPAFHSPSDALACSPRRHWRPVWVKGGSEVTHEHALVACRRTWLFKWTKLGRRWYKWTPAPACSTLRVAAASGAFLTHLLEPPASGSVVAFRSDLANGANGLRAQAADHAIDRILGTRPCDQVWAQLHVLVNQARRQQLIDRHQRRHE